MFRSTVMLLERLSPMKSYFHAMVLEKLLVPYWLSLQMIPENQRHL